MKDDGGDDKEKPSGQKISGSDFDRDGGDDSDKDSDSGDGEKSAKSDNEDINGELEDLVISSRMLQGHWTMHYVTLMKEVDMVLMKSC